jgi:hypothetical protein
MKQLTKRPSAPIATPATTLSVETLRAVVGGLANLKEEERKR